MHLGPRVATSQQAISGTESDSDSILSPENQAVTPSTSASAGGLYTPSISQPPLSAIAEGSLASEDSEDDREGDDYKVAHKRKSSDETIIRSGYLWKKGERRKVRVILNLRLHTFLGRPFTRLYRDKYISRLGRSDGSF